MTVAVVGGTGTLGSLVVADLLGRGERVAVLSRRAAGVPAGAEHRRVDLTTGEGLDLALDGVHAVVDAANSQKGAKETLVAGTGRLLEAGALAGVANHVTISIVGIDRLPMSYYRAKLAQEEALEAGDVPWTLLRATQFHQLVDSAFAAAARFGVRPTGTAKVQPIDPTVVAARLAEAAPAAPAGRLPDIGGPRVQTLTELSGAWAAARGKRRLHLRVPAWGKIGKGLAAGAICDARAAAPGEDFEEWLRHE
ncbi:MAG TPA: NAD(P)H-binding protein [Solirubrobacterales bacterium]|jgi:uncharacterized protein YbjT (DUF2867 family)